MLRKEVIYLKSRRISGLGLRELGQEESLEASLADQLAEQGICRILPSKRKTTSAGAVRATDTLDEKED